MTDSCGFYPLLRNQFARLIQTHSAIDDFPEQTLPVIATDGDKTGLTQGIIISL
jgi:hypothetical protein